jgi:selenocysteine lyase/cysteine desulfurase
MALTLREQRIYVTARSWAGEDYFRVSPHFYNTEEDVERFVWAVAKFG